MVIPFARSRTENRTRDTDTNVPRGQALAVVPSKPHHRIYRTGTADGTAWEPTTPMYYCFPQDTLLTRLTRVTTPESAATAAFVLKTDELSRDRFGTHIADASVRISDDL